PHPQLEREGMFCRGSGLNLTSGQYMAPVAGYYAFTATLLIGEPSGGRKEAGVPKGRKDVLSPAPPSLFCSNLETMSWLEGGGDLFTISVTGVFYLQAGQYASVFMDNAAGSPLTIQSSSDFSTILLGV
ncbi:ERFE protein, partial [Anhinga rufa]|nr:ERFE protein [Anhinga rufa]